MRDAVILLVLGTGTVFLLLYTINLMIVILGRLISPKTKEAPAAERPAALKTFRLSAPVAGPGQEEVAILFGAAVAAYLGTSPDRIRLVVRPVETSKAWSQAGRLDNMI